MRRKIRRLLSRKNEIIIGVAAGILLFSSIIVLWIASFQLPDLGSFENRIVSQSTKIYDRTGTVLLYDINQGVRRTVVKSDDISRNVKNAAVAIEDSDFYQHKGVKPTAFLRAIWANLTSGSYSQGGSTITQQVIKNALLTQDKSISRKIKEWVLSVKLEGVMSKDEILTLYLNEAPYGGNIYGTEEASRSFFGKHASEVNLAEAAYLAALPNAPSYYSPYGGNRKALENRKNLVLERMLKKGFVSQDEYDAALDEKVEFLPQESVGLKAPHFVMTVKKELEKQYGEEVMQSSGFRVITTLNYDLQAKAEEIAKRYALENEVKYKASNASLTAVDVKNGDVLVMVGSRNYFDQNIDGNFNVALAKRQPGSSIKPVVYAAAFEKGYTPKTIVFDLQTEFSTECNPDGTPIIPGNEDKCYMPENYDEKYRGPVSLKEALAQSINIPAIKVLYLAGLRDAINLANNMGIESLNDPDRYGLTLVLGGGEVTPLELTGAYAVFANDGVRNPPHYILRIEDASGKTIYSYSPDPNQVLNPNIAREITDILSDNEARTPLFGSNSPLYFEGYDVAAKTGTTNDYRDAWTVGYTPRIAVGAWVGNNDNSSMEKLVSGYLVAPMWNAFMKEVLKSEPISYFRSPELPDDSTLKPALRGVWQGGETYFVDSRTGLPGNLSTPDEFKQEKIIPNVHSILYWVNKGNPMGPKPEHPENDSQFNLWESPIQKWVVENNIMASIPPVQISSPSVFPTTIKQPKPLSASFVSPVQGKTYLPTNKIDVTLSIVGDSPPIQAEFYANGQFIGSTINKPFSISFIPKELSLLQKYNNLKAVVYSSAGEKVEAATTFIVSF